MLLITVIKGNVHYSIFTTAAQQLFVPHENPYNRPLDPNIFWQTLWLYSPTGALFFLPFSYLPPFLGILFYVGGSFGLFVSGVYNYCKTYLNGLVIPGILSLILLSETLGAIQATKFELLTCGLLFWIFYWFASGKDKRASFFLGLLSSIKFQTLPIVGLLAICFVKKKNYGSFLIVTLSFLTSLIWPWLIWPHDFVSALHSDWFGTLSTSASLNWGGGQSLPVFLNLLFDLKMEYADFSRISFVYAALCAGFVLFIRAETRLLYNLCLCLGSSFTVLFSPLSQSSSYILTTPLVLLGYFIYKEHRKTCGTLLGAYWFTTSLLYSDLVPKAARHFAYNYNLKPVGTALLVLFVVGGVLNGLRRRGVLPLIPSMVKK